jgi:nucleoprotein TPR
MKEYEATLTRQLDTAREEASKFRLEAKRAASDADYNKQRFERISKTLEGLQKEVSRANQEKSKLQSNVVATEQRSSSLQNSLDSLRREKSVAEAELRSALLSRDVAVASENRFKESIEVMRRELASKDALIESVKRIEAGLSNQNIEERKRLDEEIARLNKVVTEERQKASEERASMGRKLTLAEDNLKTVERAKSDAAVESANARERVALANAQVKALEDKVGTLTSQLMGMQADGLSTLPPAPMATTASASSAIVTPDLEATKKALVEAKKHAANYQKIATATDKELKDTVALYSRKEKETTAMLARLKKSEETAKKSLASKIEALDALGKDLMNQKQSQETEKKRLEAQIADLRSQIASTKTEYADNSTKMNEMLDEIKSHMAASKSSQDAYERELTLHSEARSSLREARDTMDTERRMRQAAETELASLRAEFDGNKAVWKDEKDKLLVSIKTVEEMVKVSKGENELLHSQVATLSDASKRLEAGASTPADLESSNAKSLAEMREVVNFMRTERELVENKLEVMKQELECERVSASVAKRSLDEARGELKRREEVRMDGQMRSEACGLVCPILIS